MYLSVDRVIGDIAVCEDDRKAKREIRLDKLSFLPKEGDVLLLAEDGSVTFSQEETNRRRQRILELQKKLFE